MRVVNYHELDPLYWSVADIIDSILLGLDNPMLLECQALLKSDLTAVVRSNIAATGQLFYSYGYPGLAPENRRPFFKKIVTLLDLNSDVLAAQNAVILKSVLQAGLGLSSLGFVEGCPPHLLIDDFSAFYLNRISLFKYANHILDMEETIREHFLKTPLTSKGKPVIHYRFTDSKTEPGIQLADIVVGILGKMHSYFTETGREEVVEARRSLTGTRLRNAELLRDLIAASHDVNTAFLHHVASLHDIDKLDLFLRFHDGAYVA